MKEKEKISNYIILMLHKIIITNDANERRIFNHIFLMLKSFFVIVFYCKPE